MLKRLFLVALLALVIAVPPVALRLARAQTPRPLVVYSGRSKTLVEPLFQQFSTATGIAIEARYAGSTDMANLLLEERDRTPADVFFSQDPGALGAVAEAGLLSPLPDSTLGLVERAYCSPKGEWVGVSGRARVISWSRERLKESDVPSSVFDLTNEQWRGRVGWAPSNASFQLFITAMRHLHGDEKARQWLLDMKTNGARDYPSNRPVIQAIADGEVDLGLVNHYYLHGFVRERGPDFPVANKFLPDDVGGMMSVAGVGVLKTSTNRDASAKFVAWLLAEEAQRYFAGQTGEFPLVIGLKSANLPAEAPRAESLERLGVDLGSLSDLRATLDLLRETQVLP